jgi:hypothetical protein
MIFPGYRRGTWVGRERSRLMGEGSARMVAHRLRAVRCVTLKSGRVSRLVRS